MKQCEQQYVGRLQSDADGRMLTCADDRSEFWKS